MRVNAIPPGIANTKSWITNKAMPVVLQSAVNGGLNALCARLFTSVPPAGIGVFVANATVINHVANGLFKYDYEQLAEGEPEATLKFAARTITMIYVPHALTTALGYEVNPSDCLKVGLITMATVAATIMTGVMVAKVLSKQLKVNRN